MEYSNRNATMQLCIMFKEKFQKSIDQWKTRWNKRDECHEGYFEEK